MNDSINESQDYTTDGADGPRWDAGLEDDSSGVMKMVGRQIKAWREAAGLTQTELGTAIGYGEEMVSKVERGIRVPKPEFLDNADRVLGAGGRLSAMKPDVAEARYPKKVRDLAKLEADAVELGAYGNHNIHGLLQTEEYARALFAMRRPSYSEDEIDRQVEARIARRPIFERRPLPLLTFVVEEVTLRRPLGGKMVLRRQLEHMLTVGRLRHVEIQVMPTDREDHAGMGGELAVIKLRDGTTVGYSEAQLTSRLIAEPKEVQILEMRYGMIRSQALTPRESLAFIEKVRRHMTLKTSTGARSALEWTKSSYSGSDNNDCVEVAWFKSSYSASNSNDCVEVALTPATVLVRDSKDPEGPHLTLTPTAWSSFLAFAAHANPEV